MNGGLLQADEVHRNHLEIPLLSLASPHLVSSLVLINDTMSEPRPHLHALKQPLAIRAEYIAPQTTKINIKLGFSWSSGDFTAEKADGSTILSSQGIVWSWSARKEVKDASGLPLFNLRCSWFSLAKAWRLELPGDGHIIMVVRPRWSLGRLKLECTFTNAAPGGEGQEVKLEVQGQDFQHLETHINYEGNTVAVVRRFFSNRSVVTKGMFKPLVEVEVAEGFDTALVSCKLNTQHFSMRAVTGG